MSGSQDDRNVLFKLPSLGKYFISLSSRDADLYGLENIDFIKTRDFYNGLQKGPTCGLFLIFLLFQAEIPISELIALAKESNYSYNGEMFSVKNTISLLHKIVDNQPVEVQDKLQLYEFQFEHRCGALFSKDVVQRLLDGKVIMVPYDCDFNHYPCSKKGHKAHWALVTGIVFQRMFAITEETELDPDNIYITARHGKTSRVCLWKLKDLNDSNRQLEEFSPKREQDDLEYVLPMKGIGSEDGLKSQFIVVTLPTSSAMK